MAQPGNLPSPSATLHCEAYGGWQSGQWAPENPLGCSPERSKGFWVETSGNCHPLRYELRSSLWLTCSVVRGCFSSFWDLPHSDLRPFTEPGAHYFFGGGQVGWIASPSKPPICVSVSHEVLGLLACMAIPAFMWVLGFELRSLCLHSEHPILLSHISILERAMTTAVNYSCGDNTGASEHPAF